VSSVRSAPFRASVTVLRPSEAHWLERWEHRVIEVLFPIATGPVIAGLKTFLAGRGEAYASNVFCGTKFPVTKQARMVTVRDDSGPTEGVLARRQLGFNVWAESAVNAELLALLLMAGLRTLPNGDPITAVDDMSGPFEITDEQTDLLVVGSTTLTHYFFTARVSVRGADL
jgi:hypothetical protein